MIHLLHRLTDNSRVRLRLLNTELHSRTSITREPPLSKGWFIHLLYANRAFEWIKVKQLFIDCLYHLGLGELTDIFHNIVLGWSYLPSIRTMVYQPHSLFCDFDIASLSSNTQLCICHFQRFQPFLDPATLSEKHLAFAC